MNADLHCHSCVSDGTLTPEALAKRIRSRRRDSGLTDRRIGGPAKEAALALGLAYLLAPRSRPASAARRCIVGLGFDADNAALAQGLAATARRPPNEARDEMAEGPGAGIRGSSRARSNYVGKPRADLAHPSRATWSRDRRVPTPARYSAASSPKASRASCRNWASLRDAVRWIDAGGMAVIAHPARYAFTANEGARALQRIQGTRRARRRGGDRQPQRRRSRALRRGGAGVRFGRLARQRFPQPRREATPTSAPRPKPGQLTRRCRGAAADRIQQP